MSHDLRTPLVSSLAQLEVAAQQKLDHIIWKTVLQKQKKLSQKTLKLVEEFVQLARAENLNSFSFHELNLVDVVDNAIDNVWGVSEAKSIEIQSDYEKPYMPVFGDFDTLERVIVNLLSNAVKYSPENTVVKVHINRKIDRVECSVQDEGCGISAKEQEEIFDKYSRFKRQEKSNDSSIGLGLAFVKTSVEKHGATISLESGVNKGSLFCIRFPGIDKT